MSIYFDTQIKLKNGNIICVAWHEKHNYLGVALFDANVGGSVVLLKDEGERIPDADVNKPCSPTCLAWHPQKLILIVGWETGEITVRNEKDKQVFEFPPVHKMEIRDLAFNGIGIRIITADGSGSMNLWKLDMQGKPQPAPAFSAKVPSAIVTVLLQPVGSSEDGLDLSTLAKLAVSGDERALDLFASTKGSGPAEANCFFIGTVSGAVHYFDERGRCRSLFESDGAVKRLLFHHRRNVLISVTDGGVLTQHSISPDGSARELTRFKLSCRNPNPDIIWAGKSLLAMAMGEQMVRFWDIVSEDNFTLSTQEAMGYEAGLQITSIAYSDKKQVLVAGSQSGQIAFWRFQPKRDSQQNEPEDDWQLQQPLQIHSSVTQLTWGCPTELLAVAAGGDVSIVSQQPASCHHRGGVSVVQTGPRSVYVANFQSEVFLETSIDCSVRTLRTSGSHVACADGRQVSVFELPASEELPMKQVGQFPSDSVQLDMYEQNLYTMEPGKIQVRTLQGTVKQLLSFADNQGEPIRFVVNGRMLVAGTGRGFVRVFDLSRREAKAHGEVKFIREYVPRHASIHSLGVNSNGTFVSVVCQLDDLSIDPRVYIWDVEKDTVSYFNFKTGRSEQDEHNPDTDGDKELQCRALSGRYPVSHNWDAVDARLLAVEANLTPHEELLEQLNITEHDKVMRNEPEKLVISIFCSSDHGIVVQDSFGMHESYSELLCVDTPFYFFTVRPDMATKIDELDKSQSVTHSSHRQCVTRRTMRDFIGLEESDQSSRDAMMDFSFYLTIGNIDEAFKAMKLIKSESVWQNMARMCVKTGRLDVTSVCLGKMHHARGAMMLRQAQKASEGSANVLLATLAAQLGMREEAERLLESAARYDLLNAFYRAEGKWEKAIEVAEKFDRMNLRTTRHEYGKHLERLGEYDSAIEQFILADTHRSEVPRMLCDRPQQLEVFVRKMNDAEINKWFALYLESNGDLNGALQFYDLAKDYHSMVKLHCHMGQVDRAVELCNETGDAAACCYLARHFEESGQTDRAIHYFSRAQAFTSALRLCKAEGKYDQLVSLAMLARPEDMLDAARFLEQNEPSLADKAILLYQKSGRASHAVDLAFRSRQFTALEQISRQLDQKTDPALLQKCAEFFLENNQFDRAVALLAAGKQYQLAVRLCSEQNVPMSEELAESLTPEKGEMGEQERLRTLEDIADICYQQRNYHMACKKYTQLGNRLKAMKCLMKSGDTEKIIFFANVSKQKEIYVMAGNYLQTLNWKESPDIMKSIVQFYTRGKAMESLASFYESCAQLEIEEYQDYAKALGALAEACKTLNKGVEAGIASEDKLEELKAKTLLVKKFVDLQALYQTSRDEGLKATQQFIEELPANPGFVRLGDAYGLMIKHLAATGREKAAYNCLEELRSRLGRSSSNLSSFVPVKTLEKIHKAAGAPMPSSRADGRRRSDAQRQQQGRNPTLGDGAEEEEEDEEIGESIDEQM